ASLDDRGTVVYVTVRIPPDFICIATRRSLEEMELKEGMEVYIAFKASAVHVF
nr:TOBE domain-containing protein [Ardenticatenia bacterium]